MTDARQTGTLWTEFAGRHRGRARALLVALPLLLLSLLLDHGITGPADHRGGMANGARQASDMTGAEGGGKLAGLLAADPLHAKPKLSGDGLGAHGLPPSAVLVPPDAAARTAPGSASDAPGVTWPIAAHPRAPPAAA